MFHSLAEAGVFYIVLLVVVGAVAITGQRWTMDISIGLFEPMIIAVGGLSL